MHDQPPATEEGQELAQEGRRQEEDAMRGMERHDPDEQRRKTQAEEEY